MIDSPEACLVKSDSSTDVTDLASLSSDNDSSYEQFMASLHVSDNQGLKKSVRFSIVCTREYDVIEEENDTSNSGEVQGSYRSLGWSYSEKESDLETHIDEMKHERKQKHLRMIDEHIRRVEEERQKEARMANEIAKRQMNKRRGFRSKVLKPLWKVFVEAAIKSSAVIPTPVV